MQLRTAGSKVAPQLTRLPSGGKRSRPRGHPRRGSLPMQISTETANVSVELDTSLANHFQDSYKSYPSICVDEDDVNLSEKWSGNWDKLTTTLGLTNSLKSLKPSGETICATVKMLNGTLHYSTRTKRSSDVGFSSCTAPTLYSCLSISGAFWGLQGFWKCQERSRSSEIIPDWSILQREGSMEVKYEARSLE